MRWRLTEANDIEAYLTTFEQMMEVEEADEAKWAFRLATQHTGRAQQAYTAMRSADTQDYRMVKEAILRCYNISEETNRHRFRSTRRKDGESYTELVMQLEDLVHKGQVGARAWRKS